MSKRIVLDLTKCDGCEACTVDCSDFYRPNDQAQGIQTLKERATFAVVCRRCEHPGCVAACPYDALERQPDGVMKRSNLRCVSCKLCTQGCPFGTIYPDLVGFYSSPCHYCLDRSTAEPPCVSGCVHEAIEYREVSTSEPGVHIVDEHLAVVAPRWEKEDV
jgi:Fe-S-cluster-containing dehydrogenase component